MSIVTLTLEEFKALTGKSLNAYSNNFRNQEEYIVETNIHSQKNTSLQNLTLPENYKETFDPMMEFIVL